MYSSIIFGILLLVAHILGANIAGTDQHNTSSPNEEPQQATTISVANTTAVEKLEVEIFYEALCMDSINFMRRLHGIWLQRHDFIDLRLVPYGKAIHNRNKTTGEWVIDCQHGPRECALNIRHACILETTKNGSQAFEVIACAMQKLYSDIRQCEIEGNIDLNAVQTCVDSGQGLELFVQHGDRTRTIQMTFVPSIGSDHKFDWDEQRNWFRRFDATFCRHYTAKFGRLLEGCAVEV